MTHRLLRERWSPSIFAASYVVTDGELDELLTAARWAPSRGNLQPWAFVVCRRGSAAHEALLPLLSRGNSWWVPRASLVLIGCVDAPDPADKRPRTAEYDLGQAMAHVSLQARALGLESHQFSGFDQAAAPAVLGLPATLLPLAGIAVGRVAGPDEVAAAPERERERHHRRRERRPLRLFWGPQGPLVDGGGDG